MLFTFPAFLLEGSAVPDMTTILIIIVLGLGGLSGGTLLYYGLKHILAQSTSIILLLEPFISTVAAFILFVEIPSSLTTLGAILLAIADIIIIQKQP